VERFMRLETIVEDVEISGKPAAVQGESVRGRVRLKKKGPDAERAFIDWCSKRISAYKVPRRVEFA
jgi:long-chain acyl-CoA synthetase